MKIRPEQATDFEQIDQLLVAAFADDPNGDQQEHLLVRRLRLSTAYIPELALVAVQGAEILGHILVSKITVNDDDTQHPSLALAPVSVWPQYQNQGIGSALILAAHERARELGFRSIILLGHADYYPRFGYRPCQEFSIRLPFEVPPENCLALELVPGGLEKVQGLVEYPPAFFG